MDSKGGTQPHDQARRLSRQRPKPSTLRHAPLTPPTSHTCSILPRSGSTLRIEVSANRNAPRVLSVSIRWSNVRSEARRQTENSCSEGEGVGEIAGAYQPKRGGAAPRPLSAANAPPLF